MLISIWWNRREQRGGEGEGEGEGKVMIGRRKVEEESK